MQGPGTTLIFLLSWLLRCSKILCAPNNSQVKLSQTRTTFIGLKDILKIDMCSLKEQKGIDQDLLLN